DSDDFARVRAGRAAAGYRHRRRLRCATRDRHRCAGRNDRRHVDGIVLHPAVLRRRRAAVPSSRSGDGAAERQVATAGRSVTVMKKSVFAVTALVAALTACTTLEPPLPTADPSIPAEWPLPASG